MDHPEGANRVTELTLPQLLDPIRAVQNAYHKLVVIVGRPGSGKTRALNELAGKLGMPVTNLSLLLSQRLLSLTKRQRTLKVEELATEAVDEQNHGNVCLDNTELLFDSSLRMNPLGFLQDISRNRLIIATWNGLLNAGELTFAHVGHPDYFHQPVSGYPVVTVSESKFHLHLTT